MSSSRIVARVPAGTAGIAGVPVRVTEIVWSDGGRSFEVHRTDNGADLTINGCFDACPGPDQIRALLPGFPEIGSTAPGVFWISTTEAGREYREGPYPSRQAAREAYRVGTLDNWAFC